MNPCLSETLLADGIIGPGSLSSERVNLLPQLVKLASGDGNPRNLHSKHSIVRSVLRDSNILNLISNLFSGEYLLWRTNFFIRHPGFCHDGIPLHHDKHFQSGDQTLDFYELGSHLSLIIALDDINESNGCFQFLPGSHYGLVDGLSRDTRPFELRPLSDHFPYIPSSQSSRIRSLNMSRGTFCLFHSALLHGSAPSSGLSGRISMVARLVRSSCLIPDNCANSSDIFSYL